MIFQNLEIVKRIVRKFKLQSDIVDNNIDVIATIPIDYEGDCAVQAANNATSGNILTTSLDKDTYIYGAFLTVVKDATSTSTSTNINITKDGLTKVLLSIPCITLTAQTETVSVAFAHPIKIDRGITITVTNSTNVANVKSTGGVYYYTE